MVKRFFLTLMVLFNISFAAKDTIPIVIEADNFEYHNKEKLAIYKNNVVVRKGNFTLYADKMNVLFNEEGDIKEIEAVGNVKFRKGEYSGSSEKALYFAEKDLIKLIGKAKVKKGNNILEGDEINYFLKEEKAIVKGKNKKVRTIIIPEETKK